MRRFSFAFLFLVLISLARAQETSAYRFIQFRDGSILRLPIVDEKWQVTIIQPTGKIEETALALSSLQSLTLTREKGFAKKRALLGAVGRLGSEEFRDREEAHDNILRLGPAIRPDLEMCLNHSADVETQTRLKAIIKQWPAKAGPETSRNAVFDLFQLKNSHWGYLGDAGIPVRVKEQTHRLTRADVLAMTVAAPVGLGGLAVDYPGVSGFRRLRADEFPPGCVEEPFEKTAEGRPLRVGENIEKLFIGKGFVLSTSIAGSFVSVNSFMVLGKSRGMSAANHQPLWEGEITVRFVQPGRPKVPATVTHFGCHIAAVVPKGTAMIAYDLAGQEVGRIETENNGHAFLGVSSATPIHRIRFVPNLVLDRDYTLDDFIFTPPQTPEMRHPEKFTVYLTASDRFFCRDVILDRDTVQLKGMPGGLPDMAVPRSEVLRINGPDQGRPAAALPPGFYAELRDGSVLFGALPKDKPPVFSRRPKILTDRADLAGLWNIASPRLPEYPKPGQAIRWAAAEKKWQDISQVRFLEAGVTWKNADAMETLPYQKLGPLWLNKPSPHPASGWHLRTRDGDDLVIAEPDKLAGQLSGELQAVWQGQPLRLMAGEMRSLYQVRKNP